MYDLTDVIDIRLNFFEVQSSAPCYVLLEIRNVNRRQDGKCYEEARAINPFINPLTMSTDKCMIINQKRCYEIFRACQITLQSIFEIFLKCKRPLTVNIYDLSTCNLYKDSMYFIFSIFESWFQITPHDISLKYSPGD